MLSRLRKDLIYEDITPDIVEHDEDIDAELLTLDGREVYCGAIDPRYTSHNLDVHWLYDDALKRVGLIEYDSHDRSLSETLWVYDNPYATYFQEPGWTTTNRTVWSKLSNEAYQDCLEHDFSNLVEMSLYGDTRIILPYMLTTPHTEIYECEACNKRTLSLPSSCPSVKKFSFSGLFSLFLDDSFVICTPPHDSVVWSRLQLLRRDDDQSSQAQQQEQEQAPPPADSHPPPVSSEQQSESRTPSPPASSQSPPRP